MKKKKPDPIRYIPQKHHYNEYSKEELAASRYWESQCQGCFAIAKGDMCLGPDHCGRFKEYKKVKKNAPRKTR